MIEVEKKFRLTEEELALLLDGAKERGVTRFTDVCYDDTEYSLTTADRWLRARDGVFQYKIRFDKKDQRKIDRYHELEGDELREALHLSPDVPLEEAIKAAGYEPFANYTTERREYTKDGFTIAIDSMDFGYHIGEIELLVPDHEVESASGRIMSFMRSYGLETERVRGKLIEYICRYRPDHRAALKKAGFHSV